MLNEVFSEKVRTGRRRLGYTQAQVAERISVSVRWYQQIERGAYLPGAVVMLRLLILLELDPKEFREGVGLNETVSLPIA